MRSSAATGVRALIMVACLVGVPLLATSGTSWWEILKKFQNFQWPALLHPVEAAGPTSSQPPNYSRAPDFDRPSANTVGNVSAAGLSPQLDSKQRAGSFRELAQGPSRLGLREPGGNLPQPNITPNITLAESSPPATLGFREIQLRLQQLGATYYLLESWGNQGQFFRFYCRMAVGGNPEHTYYFEAVNPDPLQAMQEVLQRVEEWRSGGKKIAGLSRSERRTLPRPN